ncbi:MAG: pilB [Gammaproteobacteria bacterium]|jgi:type IV pilus assembly protein PilB|nr:pilB [Gammaproteobacteria bacterium]
MTSSIVLTDPLLSHLLKATRITVEDAERISISAQTAQCSTTQFLIKEEHIPPKEIALALSHSLHLNYVNLHDIAIENIPRNLINDAFIKEHHVLPILIENNTLQLAIREPAQLSACKILKFHTHFQIQAVITEWHKLSSFIRDYLNEQQYQTFNQPFVVDDAESDQQIITFVQHILVDAIQKSASDIHFEPYKSIYRIRLRIDGILHQITELPIDVTQRITARLKIMSNLNIAEKRLPQDGRFNISANAETFRDCRISTCPTLFGEKTVVRILRSEGAFLNIDELGMNAAQQTLFLREIKKPQGMILVTGPTGSGKTLTLYSALHLLNTLDKNISTVEDPVEIELRGVNQVNVDHKANLTFPIILRAFLRQDPDILMVGEIRDKETAEIAIKSAQTGHLVLSTLHTNSAYETINRLQMMGIASFNLIDATRLILAQRLVRKLCSHCKSLIYPSEKVLSDAGFKENDFDTLKIYEATGCEHCTKGYSGRIGIFELLPMTHDIKSLIIDQASADKIKNRAYEQGFEPLQSSALEKVRAGITTLDEAYRVIL